MELTNRRHLSLMDFNKVEMQVLVVQGEDALTL